MPLTITTTLEPVGPATALTLTDGQVDDLGGGKRAAVVVTVGNRSARLRVAPMGGVYLIGLSKAARAELGVDIGDEVTATVALDTAEREVDLPDDLAAALDGVPGARAAFDALSYTKRKEAARGVVEAKRPETRQRRIDTVLAALA
ncbi:DUF1905 domain-containing protein [Gordonia sp. X0973]|uniref:YdeI/OmpD-associated family protein n=1 Tax=Gordonia sp. X0973 TaxID=2742602 RepID=UPI000F52F1AB|nr:YdeI/OmpD-associated family protein [Gordonia sp. X0973]QKT08131.1 DUF1905 domain-containing protein [Gordonia sp. X0973]